MEIATFSLGVIAGVLDVVAFGLYGKQMFQGTSEPNAATWTLWTFLAVLNAWSYITMSDDLVKGIIPISAALTCTLTLVFCFFRGKLEMVDLWDGAAFIVGVISGLIWWQYQSATYGNFILQFSIVISFVPICRGVWKNPRKEKALPWWIWSIVYIVGIALVVLRWKGQYEDFVYPINCLILHALVALLSKRKV